MVEEFNNYEGIELDQIRQAAKDILDPSHTLYTHGWTDKDETTLSSTRKYKSLRHCWVYEEELLPAVKKKNHYCDDGDNGTKATVTKTTFDSTYVCDKCSSGFQDKTALKHHIRIFHSVPCVVLRRIRNLSMRKRIYCCNCCNSIFSSRYHLELHRRKNTYECDLCGYKCLKKTTLIRHLKSTHTGESYTYRTYICDNCKKKFSTRKVIKDHLLLCKSAAPIECNVCYKHFLSESHLIRHLLLHDPKRKFACETCPYRFALKQALMKHRKQHERGDKFICEFCNLECVSFIHLNKHRQCHIISIYLKCQFCDYTSQRSDHLARHIRTHTGEKYKCDLCIFESANIYRVRKHMKEKHVDNIKSVPLTAKYV